MAGACSMFASQANNLIQIQAPTDTGDSAGDVVESFTTIATVYAVIKPASGRESLYSQQLQSPHTHKITIRFLAALMPPPVGCKHRVLYDGRTLNIVAVRDPDEGKRYLELTCDEGVAA